MKIWDWLKGKFARDKPQVENAYHFSGAPFFFGTSASGKTVNEFSAMQSTAVYACVRILAESVASLPLHVYEYKGGGKERWEAYVMNRKDIKVRGLLGRMTRKEMISYDWTRVSKADATEILGKYGLTTEQFAEMRDAEAYTPNSTREKANA